MINLIFTLIALPFVPIFLYGHLMVTGASIDRASSPWPSSFLEAGKSLVLGESKERGDDQGGIPVNPDGFASCNLFPLDQANAEFMPVRKNDYYDLKIWAGSSVAIDVDSGTLLHYDNGRKRTQIASLTKMMTAILAMENIKDLNNEDVIITDEDLHVAGTVVGCPTSGVCPTTRMHVGEKVKAINLLKAMLLNSANDAATALGVHMAGSADKFVDMMNNKAASLGLKDTHFCTPSGLEIDGRESECYSSAYDIARIGAASLKYNLIWDIMKIQEGEFSSADGKYTHVLKNTDLLLGNIPNCLGGKTGFTPLAGKSLLMGVADPSQKHRVIAVILNDSNRWEDMRSLVGWVFANYEWR